MYLYVCVFVCAVNQCTGATTYLVTDTVNTVDESSGAIAKALCTHSFINTV